jgi:hypothetical protein
MVIFMRQQIDTAFYLLIGIVGLLTALEKWSIVVYLSRFAQAAIFSMLSCTPSLNTTPSMT